MITQSKDNKGENRSFIVQSLAIVSASIGGSHLEHSFCQGLILARFVHILLHLFEPANFTSQQLTNSSLEYPCK